MNADKISKAEAGYDDRATDPRVRCGTCAMFSPPVGCTLVRGNISAGAVCAQWERTSG